MKSPCDFTCTTHKFVIKQREGVDSSAMRVRREMTHMLAKKYKQGSQGKLGRKSSCYGNMIKN